MRPASSTLSSRRDSAATKACRPSVVNSEPLSNMCSSLGDAATRSQQIPLESACKSDDFGLSASQIVYDETSGGADASGVASRASTHSRRVGSIPGAHTVSAYSKGAAPPRAGRTVRAVRSSKDDRFGGNHRSSTNGATRRIRDAGRAVRGRQSQLRLGRPVQPPVSAAWARPAFSTPEWEACATTADVVTSPSSDAS